MDYVSLKGRLMKMNRLGFFKNYVFKCFYNRDTGDEINIKNVKRVTVNYKNGVVKDYELFHDIQYIKDMSFNAEIISPFICERVNEVSCRLYIEDILSIDGNEVLIK